jgi:hypothetical protein
MGTLGAVVTKPQFPSNGQPIVVGYVTNNHVAGAEGFRLCPNTTAAMQEEVAPSDRYCAQPRFTIGRLDLLSMPTIVLSTQASNQLDAAFVVSTKVAPTFGECKGFCPPPGIAPFGSLRGKTVWKCGAATHLTKGVVTCLNATVDVQYIPCNATARFRGQIEIDGQFSSVGDSGSLVYGEDGAVGLLFAGDGVGKSFANPIQDVQNVLDVRLPPVPCGSPNFPPVP